MTFQDRDLLLKQLKLMFHGDHAWPFIYFECMPESVWRDSLLLINIAIGAIAIENIKQRERRERFFFKTSIFENLKLKLCKLSFWTAMYTSINSHRYCMNLTYARRLKRLISDSQMISWWKDIIWFRHPKVTLTVTHLFKSSVIWKLQWKKSKHGDFTFCF